MSLEPSRLSDFELLAPLGKGATAQVFDAVHRASRRPVAIKCLQIADTPDRAEIVERFAREALVVANIRSRYVGQILGFGFEKGDPFLVMERLRGETIDSLLRREQRAPVGEVFGWMAEVMSGLAECHAAGVFHRDIKPANLFLVDHPGGERHIKVIDFGVARTDRGMGDLTSAQHLLGSVAYMAPEQFVSALGVTANADIYAVGVTIFRCLSGRLPVSGKSVPEVIQAKLRNDPPLLSSFPDSPRLVPLDRFLVRALAKNPAERFRTMREMADAWQAMRREVDGFTAPPVSSLPHSAQAPQVLRSPSPTAPHQIHLAETVEQGTTDPLHLRPTATFPASRPEFAETLAPVTPELETPRIPDPNPGQPEVGGPQPAEPASKPRRAAATLQMGAFVMPTSGLGGPILEQGGPPPEKKKE